jgi:isocitrate dehydrogenase
MADVQAGRSMLHAPGGTSIAAFMAVALQAGAHCHDADGKARAAAFVIPNRCEAQFYRALLEDLQAHGPLHRGRMGALTSVGLSADGADEYGAQDSTFRIETDGRVRVLDQDDGVLFEHAVAAGDIWRLCRRSRRAIAHWIGQALAQRRPDAPVVFWLDPARPRERETLRLLEELHPRAGWAALGIDALDAARATVFSLARLRAGADVVAASGNLLRDYLGEFFGRAEAGTSSCMEVATPLLAGGLLLECGAAGCAPALAREFHASNRLRWNPLGDLLAWRAAFGRAGLRHAPAHALGQALERASRQLVREGLLPARHGPDLRQTVFHLARLWAGEMGRDEPPGGRFAALARRLERERAQIEGELLAGLRTRPDLGGYYRLDPARRAAALDPSPALTQALQLLAAPARAAGAAMHNHRAEGLTWCV